MFDLLKEICEKEYLVEIYANPRDLNSYVIGYILCYNEDYIIIKNISSTGKYNGMSCLMIENLNRIDYETKYLNNICKLIERDGNNLYTDLKNMEFNVLDIFKYIMKNQRACSFELVGSDQTDVIGFIVDVKDDYIIVNQINEECESNGKSIIFIEVIERLWFDSEEDKIRERLYNSN